MDKIKFSRDSKGEWRWVRQDEANHKTVGASSEGFDSYRNAYNNAYLNYRETVEYDKWPIEETDDTISVEVDDVRRSSDGTPEDPATAEGVEGSEEHDGSTSEG